MKRILFTLSFMAILSSCNSDDDTPNQSNFYALTVGNSWVYKYYEYNFQTNTYSDTGIVDTVSIVGTENIYGNDFYKFKKITIGNDANNSTIYPLNGESFYFLRESDGDLINSNGELCFTNNNYSEIELKVIDFFTVYTQLQEGSEEVTTEAGIFDCVYANRYVRFNNTGEISPANDKHHYKENIGLIQSTLSYISSSNPKFKKSLVSFNIQ